MTEMEIPRLLVDRISKIVELANKLATVMYPNYRFKTGYLTVFSKDDEDFNSLRTQLGARGEEKEANNGYKYALRTPIKTHDETVEVIRIRKHDAHRPELGCCDLMYKDNDYPELRKEALEKGLDIILRKGYEMIELSTFTINAYAYLVKDL